MERLREIISNYDESKETKTIFNPDYELNGHIESELCVSCGMPASRRCDATIDGDVMICTELVCGRCDHTWQNNGRTLGGVSPQGLEDHCRREDQTFKYWMDAYRYRLKNNIEPAMRLIQTKHRGGLIVENVTEI